MFQHFGGATLLQRLARHVHVVLYDVRAFECWHGWCQVMFSYMSMSNIAFQQNVVGCVV